MHLPLMLDFYYICIELIKTLMATFDYSNLKDKTIFDFTDDIELLKKHTQTTIKATKSHLLQD